MTGKLNNKTAGKGSKFELFTMNNGCCTSLFKLKTDEHFP